MDKCADQIKDAQQTDLAGLHNVLLMIAKDFDDFCKSNGITYYLMGGTALGAMRHGGFIPWDDDFDVFMDRKNYKKFLSLAPQKLNNDKYYFQAENTAEWPLFFSKLRLNDTEYVERFEDLGKMHCGIYIDIMCLYNTFSFKPLRYLQYLCAKTLSASALHIRGYNTKSTLKKVAIKFASLANFPLFKKPLFRFVSCLDGHETEIVGHFFGRAPFRKTSFLRASLGQPRRVKFNDIMLPVPSNVETYLTARFGDKYMDPPSQKVLDAYPSHLLRCNLGPYA